LARWQLLPGSLLGEVRRHGDGMILNRRSASRGRPVTNICGGSWVIMNSTRAFSATARGVTPQAQKTDISPRRLGPARRNRAGSGRRFRSPLGRRRGPVRRGRADSALTAHERDRRAARGWDASSPPSGHENAEQRRTWCSRRNGNLGAELHVARGKPGLDQGVLEGEAAAQEKRDQIVPPDVPDIASPFGQLPLSGRFGSLARQSGGRLRGLSERPPDRPMV
jgi:hypothetical protein